MRETSKRSSVLISSDGDRWENIKLIIKIQYLKYLRIYSDLTSNKIILSYLLVKGLDTSTISYLNTNKILGSQMNMLNLRR